MSSDLFDRLDRTLAGRGPAEAIDELIRDLRSRREYNQLFYALLMQARQRLGVLPVPTGPAADLPEGSHAAYEEAIRAAAREVGALYLAEGQIPQAWVYYRMIDDPEPVRSALDAFTPTEEEDIQPLVAIAFYEGVHPEKGFEWILSRYGLCSAITTVGGESPHSESVKQGHVRALVRALYEELRGRLANEIETRESVAPSGGVRELIQGREWLFADDAYHIDTSHLSSVVQMAMSLPPCPELGLARELCALRREANRTLRRSSGRAAFRRWLCRLRSLSSRIRRQRGGGRPRPFSCQGGGRRPR